MYCTTLSKVEHGLHIWTAETVESMVESGCAVLWLTPHIMSSHCSGAGTKNTLLKRAHIGPTNSPKIAQDVSLHCLFTISPWRKVCDYFTSKEMTRFGVQEVQQVSPILSDYSYPHHELWIKRLWRVQDRTKKCAGRNGPVMVCPVQCPYDFM